MSDIERQTDNTARIMLPAMRDNRLLLPHEEVALAVVENGGPIVMVESATVAIVYVYSGEFVADCPRGCCNTEFMTDKNPRNRGLAGDLGEPKKTFICTYCKFSTRSVLWPPNAKEIMDVLDKRPIPHTRNWYSKGHPTAVKHGLPNGQSIAELERESAENGVI